MTSSLKLREHCVYLHKVIINWVSDADALILSSDQYDRFYTGRVTMHSKERNVTV
jgi:hypothetical protein